MIARIFPRNMPEDVTGPPGPAEEYTGYADALSVVLSSFPV